MNLRIVYFCAVIMFAAEAAAVDAVPKFAAGNSSAPIEITADALEVLQENNKAIFSGNVVAIQDQVRLKSDKMTVFYRNSDGKKQAGQDAIRKIEVEGNVFMTTPEETASGLSGLYDVEHKKIILHQQVVLTRGKNTLKGDELVYDMGTGKSVVKGGVTKTGENGTVKERVRALFVPDNKDKKSE